MLDLKDKLEVLSTFSLFVFIAILRMHYIVATLLLKL